MLLEHYIKNRAVEKIFLADGDALVVPTDILIQVLDYIKEVFPECKRVSIYGTGYCPYHQKSVVRFEKTSFI